MSSKDSVVPFVFDALAVRGAVVPLERNRAAPKLLKF
jgi:hypothetical protein